MRLPQKPPAFDKLIAALDSPSRLIQLSQMVKDAGLPQQYLHWDKLRHCPPPKGISHREWWLIEKVSRLNALKPVSLTDLNGQHFQFAVPELIQKELHQIDLEAGGTVGIPEPILNQETRDRYLVSSLMEEAITSSQLEGAVTTREVAKEMIRTGRKPRDLSERMILNNYATMQRIHEQKESPLTPELVFEVHKIVTAKTLDDPTAAGRFRREDEKRIVGDEFGQIFHDPPPAAELAERMAAMCAFANGETPVFFVHPALRAMILHFWLAYDHPFVDGNGRTARALFYWAMLHYGYWLFEFISISNIIRKSQGQYLRSFLYTETDDNDLTHFLVAQTEVIRRAIRELHEYIQRKTAETRALESKMRGLDRFNHRQVEIIRHALKHPGQRYTFASHQRSHAVAYQTARTDLRNLADLGLLEMRKRGKQLTFIPTANLPARLSQLEKLDSL